MNCDMFIGYESLLSIVMEEDRLIGHVDWVRIGEWLKTWKD